MAGLGNKRATDPQSGRYVVVVAFFCVVGGMTLLALAARRFRTTDALPTLEDWALANRSLGPMWSWSLLGGTVFTAYTFTAVPGLVYGAGAIGFFALPYTVIVWPIAFVLLPRLSAAAHQHGFVTVADYVRARYGSPSLALVVALTGILATMPYLALQLLGIRAMLTASGLSSSGAAGDFAVVAVVAGLAAFTYLRGLRAPTVVSAAKAVGIFAAAAVLIPVVLVRQGGPEAIFTGAARHLAALGSVANAATIEPHQYWAFATLALGSALALLMYPHVLIAAFAASGPDTLRKVSIGMPAWTAVLGVFALLGVAALAGGISAPPGNAEDAVPQLVAAELPAVAAGLVFGAIAVGALVPFTVMSIAAGTSFVRNVYVEYFHRTATPKRQMRLARLVTLIAMAGAVAFVLGLRNQAAINLQLLGGAWILQVMPAVAIGLYTRRLHHQALLAGWAAGMVASTAMVVHQGFSPVVAIGFAGHYIHCYAGLAALVLNLVVTVMLTAVLDRVGVSRRTDATTLPPRLTFRPHRAAPGDSS